MGDEGSYGESDGLETRSDDPRAFAKRVVNHPYLIRRAWGFPHSSARMIETVRPNEHLGGNNEGSSRLRKSKHR
jgi:hypothetical protein